nr:RNA-directed DNA polymerase, eukaryota, reverse transcriptase zinc-binding domain protein [Tanacetum cinerariifolium]
GSSQNKKSYTSSLNGDRDSKVEKQVTVVKGNTLMNVPLTPSLITPALVLDDSCVSVRDLSWHVMGRVKDLNSILNLLTLLTKEGFLDVKLTYLGGMWVMVQLDNEVTKLKLLQHIRVNSWFHVLQHKGVAQDSDSSLSHPPGFTSEVSRQENDHRGVDLNTKTDKVNSPIVYTKVMNNSHEVGQSMGYVIEGCMKDIEHIIGTQGVDTIPK